MSFTSWDRFLPPHDAVGPCPASVVGLAGRCVLVTGAAGFIGSALCRMLLATRADRLVLLDCSEHELVRLHARLATVESNVVRTPVLGSVTDRALVEGTVCRYRPSVILHAAAYKHVPFLEFNPRAAVQANALGTWIVARAALRGGVEYTVLVSTDKAVRPASVMGASKRVAELVVAALGTDRCRMNAVRLCNVIGSTGSAIPIFLDQISRRLPVTVTHPEATRYFVSLSEAAGAILECATAAVGPGRVLVPAPGAPVRIADLVRALAHRGATGNPVPVQYTGLRPGEKLHEELTAPDECEEGTFAGGLTVVRTPALSPSELERLMNDIERLLVADDLAALPAILCRAVPAYVPSPTVLAACGAAPRSAP